MDVSAVIPTFRRPKPLQEAIQSVLRQEGVTVEIIVVDDSPEGSAAPVVESLNDPRVTYLKMPTPTGGKPSAVRNHGWPRARGAYVHFLDDDDIVEPGAYAAVKTAFEAHPELGVVVSKVAPFGDDAQVLAHQKAYFESAAKRAKLAWTLRSSRMFVANMLYKPTLMVCSAGLIRRECIEKVGGFDPQVRLVEDVDFYLNAIRLVGAIYLDRVVINYRTGAPSLMHSEKDFRNIIKESYRLMFSKYQERHGRAEMLAMRLMARTALRWM